MPITPVSPSTRRARALSAAVHSAFRAPGDDGIQARGALAGLRAAALTGQIAAEQTVF